jgi:hypothetical protein
MFFQCHASASALTGEGKWYKSGTGACEAATIDLFKNLPRGSCNCESKNETIGGCALNFQGCFHFENVQSINDKKPTLKVIYFLLFFAT